MPEPPPAAVFKLELAGRAATHLDAMLARRRLVTACPDWWEKVTDLAATARPLPPGVSDTLTAARSARRLDLASSLASAVSRAFDMPPIDPATGSGYTEDERLTALSLFLDFGTVAQEVALPLAHGGGSTDSPATPAP